jgi:2'-5' RNA ligase
MRLFVSVDLPEAFAEAIAAVQSDISAASGLSLTDPEQAHVTLKFLGEVDDDWVDELTEMVHEGVTAANVDSFECTVGGLGVFPSLEYISVVWLGIQSGADPLQRLHESIEASAVDAGFDPEDHDFTPHVTIGRMNHGGGKELVQETVETEEPEIGTFEVERVRLKESTLTSDGPDYSTVAEAEL